MSISRDPAGRVFDKVNLKSCMHAKSPYAPKVGDWKNCIMSTKDSQTELTKSGTE